MQALGCRPAHEAGDNSTAGKAVQHSNLFRNPYRVVDGNDVAEDGDLGLLRNFADDIGQ